MECRPITKFSKLEQMVINEDFDKKNKKPEPNIHSTPVDY
ncbi:hypothetical protein SS322685_2874 [Shigella sonnei 3226-85]|nr:hypothetical protein SS322685_2874 [Shigella sonnei 3226-85]EIQ43588.1 hypothetical protein SS323385_2421 [Shigella sonnei 3233-85]